MNLFIFDYQPFSIVEDKGFNGIIKMLCPTYVLPNRRASSSAMILAQYEKALVDVLEIF